MQKVCVSISLPHRRISYPCTGYKVGRVDQAETALGAEMRVAADKGKSKGKTAADKADKIVRRTLNKVYTNGTLVDETLLTDEQAGHCVSIREDGEEDPKTGKQKFGLCVLDSSTSEFNLSAFEDDVCRTKLETMMRQLRPKEMVFTKVLILTSCRGATDQDVVTGQFNGVYKSPPKSCSPRELFMDQFA